MPPKRNPEERFWEKVDKTDGCWLWTAGKSHGYGVFHPTPHTRAAAHRWAYEALIGPIPEGTELDHLCRMPACVNPDHLEPVPHDENCRRGVGFSGTNARKVYCDVGHKLAGRNLYVDPRGRRQCKTCRAAAAARVRAQRGDGIR